MLIPKFHPFLHILIKPVWFVAWASGLELPRWRACERLWKEMRTFHSRELKGPLQSKVLRCSNRPRGKGHLPTLAPCQFSHLSFLSCHVVSVVLFSSPGKWVHACAQPCLTLHDPKHCGPPGSSAHGIFQTRVLEWAISFSRGSSRPRDRTPHLLHWQAAVSH